MINYKNIQASEKLKEKIGSNMVSEDIDEYGTPIYGEKTRADILIEALPYIKYFHEKIVVIKYGGSVMDDDTLSEKVIEDIALLKLVGFRPVIVHGGGKEISKWVEVSGGKVKFIDGYRVTDEATIDIAQMVLNRINKNLVRRLSSHGVKAVGLSGIDGNMLECTKKVSADGSDLGFVGDVKKVNTDIINIALNNNYVPIICPIGVGEDFKPYNINADAVAYSVAAEVKALKLAFLTDVEGLYKDFNDKTTLISEISVDDAEKLLQSESITGGMIPKLSGCIQAIKNGVSRVHIIDGRIPHSLILEFFTHKGVGTAIIGQGNDSMFTA